MRRTLISLEWTAVQWEGRMGGDKGATGYAARQASIFRGLRERFAAMWQSEGPGKEAAEETDGNDYDELEEEDE